MRWVLLLAFCAGVAATTWAGLRNDEPGLRLTIHQTMPFADPGDPNPLGRQSWGIRPRFSVDPRCEGLRLTAGSRVLFNGQPVPEATEADGRAGDTVIISARARCRDGSRAEAEREFQLPTASCDGGPIRIFELRGSATSWDLYHEDRPMELREGDLVTPGSALRVSSGGRIELGAPECNGLRALLFGGDNDVGGYERSSRGYWFSGNRIVARGDEHSGGFYVPGGPGDPPRAHVSPLGPQSSSYAVRSTGPRVTVRVYRGLALVSGTSESASMRVGAGEQASVLCSAPRRCVATRPRFFQPNEPWFGARARPLARLAPRFARFDATRLPAAGGNPEQMLIEWEREIRVSSTRVDPQRGAILWQRDGNRWRRVYERLVPLGPSLDVDLGDVTGDGHADVLFSESVGTGGCGPRYLVATVARRVRELYRRGFCEGGAAIERGVLRVHEAVGPCPYPEMSVHCRGGLRTTVLRWNRSGDVVERRIRVRCGLPRLDPASSCARNRPEQRRNNA